MKIFVSWSGETSKKLAEALHAWIPNVIQSVEPYMSSEDIRQGSRWFADISTHLEEARFGILCLTPENLEAPWLLFEAGALSKIVDASLVVPYLFNLSTSDLQGPLAQFQATRADEESTREMLLDLNSTLGDQRLEESRLVLSFDHWWPELASAMGTIQSDSNGLASPREERDVHEILEEILEVVRQLSRQSFEDLPEIKAMLRVVRNTMANPRAHEYEAPIRRRVSFPNNELSETPSTVLDRLAEIFRNLPKPSPESESTTHLPDGDDISE